MRKVGPGGDGARDASMLRAHVGNVQVLDAESRQVSRKSVFKSPPGCWMLHVKERQWMVEGELSD